MAATDNARSSVVHALENARDELNQFLDNYFQIWLADHDPTANVLENKVRNQEKENIIKDVFLKEWSSRLSQMNRFIQTIKELENKRTQERKFVNDKELMELVLQLKTKDLARESELARFIELEQLIWRALSDRMKESQNRISSLQAYINRLEIVKENYLNQAHNYIRILVNNIENKYKRNEDVIKIPFVVSQQLTDNRTIQNTIAIDINLKTIKNQFDDLLIKHMVNGDMDNRRLKEVTTDKLTEIIHEEIYKALMLQYPGLSEQSFNKYSTNIHSEFIKLGYYESLQNRIDQIFHIDNAAVLAKVKYCQVKAKSIDNCIARLQETLEIEKDHLTELQGKVALLEQTPAVILDNFENILNDINLDLNLSDINLDALTTEIENEAILDEDSINQLLEGMSIESNETVSPESENQTPNETKMQNTTTTNMLFKTLGVNLKDPRVQFNETSESTQNKESSSLVTEVHHSKNDAHEPEHAPINNKPKFK